MSLWSMPLLAQAETKPCRKMCQPRMTDHFDFVSDQRKWRWAIFVEIDRGVGDSLVA
jgi:hypothetical protein